MKSPEWARISAANSCDKVPNLRYKGRMLDAKGERRGPGRRPKAGIAAKIFKGWRFTAKQWELISHVTEGDPKRYLVDKVVRDGAQRQELTALLEEVQSELKAESEQVCPVCKEHGMLVGLSSTVVMLRCSNGHNWSMAIPGAKRDGNS